jgi:pyruvyl transferase EpsO
MSEANTGPGDSGSPAVVNRLANEVARTVGRVLGSADDFVLFDYPDHNNVGDSAIFLGEMAYFRQFRRRLPAYVCRADLCDFERIERRYASSLILIHGGGNFGDVWPSTHEKRERLLDRYRGRHIVQLPQSIKFNSRDRLERTKRSISRHGNFDLLVRDLASYQFAVAEFDCRVTLCPDMALCLGPLQRVGKPSHDLLMLLRRDKERAETLEPCMPPLSTGTVVADWAADDPVTRRRSKIDGIGRAMFGGPACVRDVDALRNSFYVELARKRVRRGLRLLSSGRFVIIDRLHAYILCVMLGVPRAVIDNSYGKLSGFIDTWMSGEDRLRTSGNLRAALASWAERSAANDSRMKDFAGAPSRAP